MDIEKEILAIKERNVRVEADKAWERSSLRILSVAAITYIVAALVLYLIGVATFLLSALVPTIGYLLSTQSLPIIKRWWISRFMRERQKSNI